MSLINFIQIKTPAAKSKRQGIASTNLQNVTDTPMQEWDLNLGGGYDLVPKHIQFNSTGIYRSTFSITSKKITDPKANMTNVMELEGPYIVPALSQPLNLPLTRLGDQYYSVTTDNLLFVSGMIGGGASGLGPAYIEDKNFAYMMRMPYLDTNSSHQFTHYKDFALAPTPTNAWQNNAEDKGSGLEYNNGNKMQCLKTPWDLCWISSVVVSYRTVIKVTGVNPIYPATTSNRADAATWEGTNHRWRTIMRIGLLTKPLNNNHFYNASYANWKYGDRYQSATNRFQIDNTAVQVEPILRQFQITSYSDVWGDMSPTAPSNIDRKRSKLQVYKDIEIYEGMKPAVCVVNQQVVPHKFLNMQNMDDDKNTYKQMAWQINTDWTYMRSNGGWGSIHPIVPVVAPLLEAFDRQATGSTAVPVNLLANVSMRQAVFEKSNCFLSIDRCVALLNDIPVNMKVLIEENLIIERKVHMWHDRAPSRQVDLTYTARNTGYEHDWGCSRLNGAGVDQFVAFNYDQQWPENNA